MSAICYILIISYILGLSSYRIYIWQWCKKNDDILYSYKTTVCHLGWDEGSYRTGWEKITWEILFLRTHREDILLCYWQGPMVNISRNMSLITVSSCVSYMVTSSHATPLVKSPLGRKAIMEEIEWRNPFEKSMDAHAWGDIKLSNEYELIKNIWFAIYRNEVIPESDRGRMSLFQYTIIGLVSSIPSGSKPSFLNGELQPIQREQLSARYTHYLYSMSPSADRYFTTQLPKVLSVPNVEIHFNWFKVF